MRNTISTLLLLALSLVALNTFGQEVARLYKKTSYYEGSLSSEEFYLYENNRLVSLEYISKYYRYRTLYRYDTINNSKEIISQNWADTGYQSYQKHIEIYNTQGKVLDYSHYLWSESKQIWMPGYAANQRRYADGGKVLEEVISFRADTTCICWLPATQTLYIRDSTKRLDTSYTRKYVQDSLVPQQRTIYSYVDNSKKQILTESWDTLTNNWINYSKTDYISDTKELRHSIDSKWEIEKNEWVYTSRRYYAKTFLHYEEYDNSLQKWLTLGKELRFYNEDDKVDSIVSQNGDTNTFIDFAGDTLTYLNITEYSYRYDSLGNVATEYHWRINMYNERSKEEIIYHYEMVSLGNPGRAVVTPLKVYPNPTSGRFRVVFERPANKPCTYLVTNINGQHVSSGQIIDSTTEFDLTGLPQGSYILFIYCGSDKHHQVIVKL